MATVYIGSVSPIAHVARRPSYGGLYKIEPVERGGKPFILEVTDKVEVTHEAITRREVRTTINGQDIAADILGEWCANTPGMDSDSHWGIWLIGPTPNYTAEQEKKAREALATYLNWMVVQVDGWTGERRAKAAQARGGLYDSAKMACAYLGIERDWSSMDPAKTTLCQYCRKQVQSGAIKCNHCSEVIDFKAYAALEAEKAAMVSAAMPKPIQPPLQQPKQAPAATR